MKRFLVLAATSLLAAGVALAQPQQLPPGIDLQALQAQLQAMQGGQGGMQGLGLGAPPGARYVQAQTASVRFPDATTAGPTFDAGAPVVVLVEDGDRARVMKGDSYGWIPKSALGDAPPAAAEAPAPTP